MRKLIWTACLAVWPLTSLLAQNIVPLDVRDGAAIGFRWQGDSIHGKWEPHAAMLIPVTFEHCPRQFFMQFDLGAPASILYKNKIDAIRSRYPAALPDADSLHNLTFQSGKTTIIAPAISVKQFDSASIDWQSTQPEIIGTIGGDLMLNRVAVIDYPKRRITLRASVPPNIRLFDFTFVHNRILLPANIDGKESLLFFDTGSSMFELLTDPQTCARLAIPGAEARRFPVNSWGRALTASTFPAKGTVQLAGVSIPIHAVSCMEGTDPRQVAFMTQLGIGGMTGNKLFLHNILVLDTKHQRFGLVR